MVPKYVMNFRVHHRDAEDIMKKVHEAIQDILEDVEWKRSEGSFMKYNTDRSNTRLPRPPKDRVV